MSNATRVLLRMMMGKKRTGSREEEDGRGGRREEVETDTRRYVHQTSEVEVLSPVLYIGTSHIPSGDT